MHVNVITISKNDLAGLRVTMDSVNRQTYRNFTHIVVDGDSIDGTQAFLAACKAPNVRWDSRPDLGIYDAMNRGLDLSSEGSVVFLNSSDYFKDDGCLEAMVNRLAEPACDWAYGIMEMESSDPQTKNLIYKQFPFSLWRLRLGIRWLPFEAAIFNCQFLRSSVGKLSSEFGAAGDQEYLLRAALISRPGEIWNCTVVMKPGGAHSKLVGLKRQEEWHRMRIQNNTPFLGSPSADRLILPALAVLQPLSGKWRALLRRLGR